ncbi:hypothetical protein QFZ27_003688 [Inquilinus ginsengisoli]
MNAMNIAFTLVRQEENGSGARTPEPVRVTA